MVTTDVFKSRAYTLGMRSPGQWMWVYFSPGQFGLSVFAFEAGFVFKLHDVIGILSSLSFPLLTVSAWAVIRLTFT